MSQEQPRRPADQGVGGGEEGIRYGDVFPVSGSLADEPIAPQDAATMQSAENVVFGQTPKGGPAAVMQSAAMHNERIGVVGHDEATDATAQQGVTVSQTPVPGGLVVTEFVAGQAVGQFIAADDATGGGGGVTGAQCGRGPGAGGDVTDTTKITIGEALEAAALSAGDKSVERSDAAAIQAAEARATGLDSNVPGGLAAQAQAAASANAWAARDVDKTKLRDVLSNATAKLPTDKTVESGDAGRVAGAETRNRPGATVTPGGVAASMAAAARLNRDHV